jgi:hypothetical protein
MALLDGGMPYGNQNFECQLTKNRWLFLLEGLITLLLGFASFFLMPASAVQTKTWFRPNGWFNDRELSLVVNRVLRDDPSKGKYPHPKIY